MKVEDSAFEDEHFYFALCDSCGSKAWFETEKEVNSLEEDGSQLTQRKIQEFVAHYNYEEYPKCYECEKKLSIISFKTIPKNERKKVFKMTPADRKRWVINLKVFKALAKEEWQK
jgi:hypothetical protein